MLGIFRWENPIHIFYLASTRAYMYPPSKRISSPFTVFVSSLSIRRFGRKRKRIRISQARASRGSSAVADSVTKSIERETLYTAPSALRKSRVDCHQFKFPPHSGFLIFQNYTHLRNEGPSPHQAERSSFTNGRSIITELLRRGRRRN